MATRQDEHVDDTEDFPGKHTSVSTVDGGACLNGHVSNRSLAKGMRLPNGKPIETVTEESCNYRWQGFRRALDDDSRRYNWPRYKDLAQKNLSLFTRLRFGVRKVKPPNETERSWDVTEDGLNFRSSCNYPYWHESHHIVPHGELRDAIEDVGEGSLCEIYRRCIRKGLLEEMYNLNFKDNMVILPMDRKIAKTIKLPRHRMTPGHRSHRAYSKYVNQKLSAIFDKVKKQEKKHIKKPKYKKCKRQLLSAAKALRTEIFAAGGLVSLDEAFKKRVQVKPSQ